MNSRLSLLAVVTCFFTMSGVAFADGSRSSQSGRTTRFDPFEVRPTVKAPFAPMTKSAPKTGFDNERGDSKRSRTLSTSELLALLSRPDCRPSVLSASVPAPRRRGGW